MYLLLALLFPINSSLNYFEITGLLDIPSLSSDCRLELLSEVLLETKPLVASSIGIFNVEEVFTRLLIKLFEAEDYYSVRPPD